MEKRPATKFYQRDADRHPMVGFEDLVSNKKLLLAISEMGWKEPTPIQSESVPLGLDGRDILGRAQTGSGKTGAYGIVVLGRTRSRSK